MPHLGKFKLFKFQLAHRTIRLLNLLYCAAHLRCAASSTGDPTVPFVVGLLCGYITLPRWRV